MLKVDTLQWEDYFRDIGLKEEYIQSYMTYVNACVQKRVPPIFEDNHLAQLLGVTRDTLFSMVFGTASFYRTFSIPKRRGGRREISSPYPSLLMCQRWIKEEVLSRQKISGCATGFREGKSILSNALIHCNRSEVMKIDIKDFFPAITYEMVFRMFVGFGYPQKVSYILARLCTLHGTLPQGSAASPAISNIICRRMDARFFSLCRKHKLRYTRYADDVVISGRQLPSGVKRLFFEIIEDEGFSINEEKVRICLEGDRKIITGLDITSGTPRVPRSFRRELRKDVYHVWASGLTSHVARRKIFNPNYISHLEGRINFWKQIEPECRQLVEIERRFSQIRKRYPVG